MTPTVLTRDQVRRVDALAIERYGMSGLVLMENAGRGAVDALLTYDPSLLNEESSPLAGPQRGPGSAAERLRTSNPEGVALRLAANSLIHSASQVVILCGKGNNAGDGFVIARHLEIRGVATSVLMLASPLELTGDALANYAILQHSNVPIVDVSTGQLEPQLTQHAAGAAWLVDAMLAPAPPANLANHSPQPSAG